MLFKSNLNQSQTSITLYCHEYSSDFTYSSASNIRGEAIEAGAHIGQLLIEEGVRIEGRVFMSASFPYKEGANGRGYACQQLFNI